jgi:hypothetical protein
VPGYHWIFDPTDDSTGTAKLRDSKGLTVGLIAQASEQDDGWYWQKYIPESIDG